MATKKSSARVQPKKIIEKPDFEPLEDIFDKAKTVMVMKIDANIEVSKRVDNLMNVRDSSYRFWGNQLDEKFLPDKRVEYFKRLQTITTETYNAMKDIAESFSLEEFKKKDMKDYFEKLIPKSENIHREEELIEAMIIFQCVQPYGSQMNQIHQMIQEEIEKRRAYGEMEK